MKYRKQEKSGWRVAVAVSVLALLSCGALIALDVHKIAAERKVERQLTNGKTLPRPAPTFAPLKEPEND